MKRSWVIALLLIVVSGSLSVHQARSAPSGTPPGLSMEARAAFDGYFKYGEWLPVWVELQNRGPDLVAELWVRVTGNRGTTVYASPALLPTGSHKRIPIYVLPNNFSHVLEVQLMANDDLLHTQEVPVKAQANISYLVGLVAPRRDSLTLISGASLPGQERPKTLINLSLADLPERAAGLRSFDCLILNDTDTSTLTPEQKAALETWVDQGGRLVIGGGVGATRTVAGLPHTILPLSPSGEVALGTLSALTDFAAGQAVLVPGPFVVATGDESQGRTLVAQDGVPLVRERAVGNGYVDFVALDLTASPFDAWTGTTAFWERLLSPGAAYPDWLPPDLSVRQMRSSQMAYALSRLPALDIPSIRSLGLLLTLYVVLVGPGNYLVLRWRKRLQWAWLTVPLLTLTFSAGAFGLGYSLRGADLILNRIAVIELRPDGAAGVTSYLGLFSPTRRSYEVEVTESNLLSPLTPDYNPWETGGVNVGSEMVFLQGEPGYVRGLTVNQWSMQTFMTEGSWADFGHIEGNLQVKDEALVGVLRNETPHTLLDAALVLGNRFVRLGDLRPGQEVPVTLELKDPGDQSLSQPLSFLLFQTQLTASEPGGPPREVELRRMVAESVFEREAGFGPLSSRAPIGSGSWPHGLTLIGWLDEAPPKVRVAGRTPTQQTTALLYAPVTVRISTAGVISLPPGLIPGTLVEMPSEGGRCGPNETSIWLGRGAAKYEFQIPEELQPMRADILRLDIRTDGSGWWQPPDTAVYAWDLGTWVAVDDASIGNNTISNAANLVSNDGLIRVRLSSQSNRGGCLHLALGLEGTQ